MCAYDDFPCGARRASFSPPSSPRLSCFQPCESCCLSLHQRVVSRCELLRDAHRSPWSTRAFLSFRPCFSQLELLQNRLILAAGLEGLQQTGIHVQSHPSAPSLHLMPTRHHLRKDNLEQVEQITLVNSLPHAHVDTERCLDFAVPPIRVLGWASAAEVEEEWVRRRSGGRGMKDVDVARREVIASYAEPL